MTHVSPGYSAYLNLDQEMIVRDLIVDTKLNLKLTQECLNRINLSHQCDTLKIDNALVYQIHSKIIIQRCICSHETEEECSLTSISNFLALIMLPSRLQIQKKAAEFSL